jgi:hypothetical protein
MADWQVEATFPNGAKAVFGLQARHRVQAYLKAFQRTAEFPGIAASLVITRLTPRVHHRGHSWMKEN